jgi:hypothetical protein
MTNQFAKMSDVRANFGPVFLNRYQKINLFLIFISKLVSNHEPNSLDLIKTRKLLYINSFEPSCLFISGFSEIYAISLLFSASNRNSLYQLLHLLCNRWSVSDSL